MCLDLTHPEDTVFRGETLERFRQGNTFEDDTILHLKSAGRRSDPPYRLTSEQQRVRIVDAKGRPVIVGKTDDTLVVDGQEARPLEIKGGEAVRNCRSVDDLLRGRYTKGYPRQALSYARALGAPGAVMVLKRPGWPVILDVELGARYADGTGEEIVQDFVDRAERAVAVKFGEADLPDYHTDPTVCLRCDHRGRSCAPPLDAGEGLQLVMDRGLTECARDVLELKDSRDKWERSWKRLREAFGELRRPLVSLRGRYLVKGKPAAKTTTGKDGKKTTDPEGRWLMEVEALPVEGDDQQDLTGELRESIRQAGGIPND